MSCIPDLARTREMYTLYEAGKTCWEIAIAFKTTRQSVWDRFNRQHLAMRPSSRAKALPAIEFDGARYAPEKDGYFRKTVGDRELLHHAKWIKAHGRITRGWAVRFVDGDRMNVDLDNLEMVPRNEVQRVTPIKLKPCLTCGQLMTRRATGDIPEGPAAYAKRRTCNTACAAVWRRGRRRGETMR